MKNKIKGLLAFVLSVLIGQVWAADEVISINFRSGRGRIEGSAGLVPAEGWLNVASDANKTVLSGSSDKLPMWDGSKSAMIKVGMSYWAKCGYQYDTDVSDAFLKGYLDDGGANEKEGAEIALTGIPFSEYSVIVYCATDTASRKFQAVKINGSYYKGVSEEGEFGYAAVAQGHNGEGDTWGSSQGKVAAYGTNALRVNCLTGDLTIEGGYSSDGTGPRGGIAAIQIVNTGDLTQYKEVIVVDGGAYDYVFRGTMDASYGTVANWYSGKLVTGDQREWVPVSGNVAPGVGGDMWHYILLDGEMMDATKVTVGEDGYKTISANTLEGWNLGYFVRNGVHLNVATLNKIQNGDGFTAVWRVDDTSKITIGVRGNSSHNNLANYYIDNEEGMVFTEFDIANANYYFDEDGSVKLDGVSGTQTIKAITLDLGTVAEGRKVVSRKVIGFNSSTATYTVAEGAVTTSVETVAATEAVSLQNVGEYKFEQKEDGYYVNFVAYAATDEIGEASTWKATQDTEWATEANWTLGVPKHGADATISIAADTTITIPTEGVTVGALVVNGEGTLTIAGGKLTAGKISANTSIAGDETTLALAPMNIAEGKTVTYTTTTTMTDPDSMGNVNHALSLKAMTGAGTFMKKGTGVIGLFATAAEPAIIVEEGAIYVRETPTTAMNITAKAGAEIRLAAWHHNFADAANKITLDGGAQLTLANGANVSGTITIANAAETAAKICGSSFNASTIAAAITGTGKVEFADGGAFGEGKYPCQNVTTYSGVISGGLQVIISDTSAVTFTGANTYTGGTLIADGVTLNAGTGSLGTGAVTGAGKLICTDVLPPATAALDDVAWKGTVKIQNYTGSTEKGATELNLDAYGNQYSIIELNNVAGWVADGTTVSNLRLEGNGLKLNNGSTSTRATITVKHLTGAGKFQGSTGNSWRYLFVVESLNKEDERFTGSIDISADHCQETCVFMGEGTNDNLQNVEVGKIVIATPVTIANDKTWKAKNGTMVIDSGAIGGTGTIDGTLTLNSGATLAGAVTVTGDVTVAGDLTITHADEAGDTVITCANAEAVAARLTGAPQGLKYVAENGAVKLAVANVSFVPATAESMSVTVDVTTKEAALAMVVIQRPEGVGDSVVSAEDYAAYFTKTATGESGNWTVTVALKEEVKPVIGTTSQNAGDAFIVDADGVTIAITNYKPGLYYGIRSATELGALKTVQAVGVNVVDGKISANKLDGNSAFYQLDVDAKPFPEEITEE